MSLHIRLFLTNANGYARKDQILEVYYSFTLNVYLKLSLVKNKSRSGPRIFNLN